MGEKKAKSYKLKSLLLLIITRAIQIGIFLILFDMTGPFHEAAETIFGSPKTFSDERFVHSIGMTPLFGFIPVWILTEGVRIWLKFRVTGISEEEYKIYIIEKTPPDVMEKARSYGTNSDKLMEYLKSVRKELGFTKDEIVYLYTLCHDSKKEQERIEGEKCRTKEEKRAKKEETHKKMDEAKERIKSYLKRK